MKQAVRAAGTLLVAGAVGAVATPAYASTVTQVPVASTGFYGGFTDVTAVSATDGWAVGGNGNGVVQRFNGTRWSVVASPDLLDRGANSWAGLAGVDAAAPGAAFAVGSATVWAVGSQWDGTTGQSSSIAFRITG
jgi:hypothetical protein